MLKVSLFGSLAVSLASGNSIHEIVLAARVAGLLAFLALGHGRFFSRSEIIRCFSADRDCDVSAGSLNTMLWRLRKSIERPPAVAGEFIVCNRQGAIGLNPAGSVWLDVDEFSRLTLGGLNKPLHQVTDADIRNLEAGVNLYKADVLTDFHDDWVLIEREKLRRSYLNTLGRLMQISASARNFEDAIRYAQLILETDSLREDIHRELMRFLVLNGQRALALRQFEICCERLKRELAIQPMRETLQLYQQIADSAIDRTASAAAIESAIPDEGRRHGLLSIARAPKAVLSTSTNAVAIASDGSTRNGPVVRARQLIAEADICLQESLGLIDR